MRLRGALWWVLGSTLWTLLLAAPGAAVLIDSGDGTGNTAPAADDPGFDHVGSRGGLSGVYVGGGWVLTAAHVAEGSLVLGGIEHAAVPGSSFIPGGGLADLRAYRLATDPGLPSLSLATAAPLVGESVQMIGNGVNRGAAMQWHALSGWTWGPGRTVRWGTNWIDAPSFEESFGGRVTQSFTTRFDMAGTAHEAIAVPGDSGGAVFVPRAGGWELAGLMYALLGTFGQPGGTSLYTNQTLIVDLHHYRSELDAVLAVRACSNGLDDDGDGRVDLDDPGCESADDAFETDASLPCDDGFDTDGDGLIDTADAGCASPGAPREDPQCDDDLDNDGDGGIDWDGGAAGGAPDPACDAGWRRYEAPSPGCGLGFEAAPLLVAIALTRRSRRRRTRVRA